MKQRLRILLLLLIAVAPIAYVEGRTFLVPRGTLIPCALQTRIQSDLPGLINCQVTEETYGADGTVILIDRGSRIFGEYQRGLREGETRLFVTWSELRTPDGTIIALDSPAAGPLGRAGLGGKVDYRYARRFAGALLVSIIDDTSQRFENQLQHSRNTSDTVSNDTAEMIREITALPPILYKNHGERALVYVARDLDFSEVYTLRD